MSAIERAFIRAYEPEESSVRQHPVQTSANRRALPAASARVGMRTTSPPPAATVPTSSPVVDAPPSTRRPLSAFVQPSQPVEGRFKPALEVDSFRWPAAVEQLLKHGAPYFHDAVQALLDADDAGRSLIGVGGAQQGDGATTLVDCLARLLVEAGKTVAIVDGHFRAPGLASSLGLAAEIGWEDVLAGRVPLAECAVHSLHDRIALIPLVQGGIPASEKLDAIHASVTAGVLRYHYDVVLFDLGNIGDPVQGPIARRVARQCRLDGFVLTSNASDVVVSPAALNQSAPELASICLGAVENRHHAA